MDCRTELLKTDWPTSSTPLFPSLSLLLRHDRAEGKHVPAQWTWHSTDLAMIAPILFHGFVVPPTQTHGRAYGHGIYLAEDLQELVWSMQSLQLMVSINSKQWCASDWIRSLCICILSIYDDNDDDDLTLLPPSSRCSSYPVVWTLCLEIWSPTCSGMYLLSFPALFPPH